MKKIFSLLLAVLLGGIAAQAQETGYQPLVREGVIWHYCYFDHEIAEQYDCDGLVDNKIEFYGDTILNGIEYKKCYLYRTESLDPNIIPVAYAREENGKVMIVVEGMQYGSMPDDYETHSLPGQHENLTGERIVYDFGDMSGFLSQLESDGTVVSSTYVQVGEKNARLYTVDMGQICHFVESVGRDDEYSGYMFMPFVERETSYCSEVMGLIKLTDLDGNLLYKGACFEVLPSGDINDDGKVDIFDVNAAIDVMLGKGSLTPGPSPEGEGRCDVTGDGVVDIADINAIIDQMLGKR